MISHDDSSDVGQRVVCPECGAQQGNHQGSCWLCRADLAQVNVPPAAPSASETAVSPPQQPFSFQLSTMMLLVTLAAVCFGLLAAAPGLAIPMCVLLIPVVVRTSMVVSRRQAAGKPVSVSQKVGLFLTSFAVATVLSVVVLVAAFCSFCGVCLMAFSGGTSEAAIWGVLICAVGIAAAATTVYLVKEVKRRYDRDIQG